MELDDQGHVGNGKLSRSHGLYCIAGISVWAIEQGDIHDAYLISQGSQFDRQYT
jgi:hypothetical protein